MIGLHRAVLVALILAVTTVATAHADEAADKAAIMERLQRWTANFNSNDAVGVCDLFAPDLIYSIPEVAQGTREPSAQTWRPSWPSPTSNCAMQILTFTRLSLSAMLRWCV
jgi:hypothetical protein